MGALALNGLSRKQRGKSFMKFSSFVLVEKQIVCITVIRKLFESLKNFKKKKSQVFSFLFFFKKSSLSFTKKMYKNLCHCLTCSRCHWRYSIKKGVLNIFLQISLENTCAAVSFFNKVAGLRAATLLKKRHQHRYFPVEF